MLNYSLANTIIDITINILPIIVLNCTVSPNINIPNIKVTIGSKVPNIDALEGPIILTPCKNAISATTVDINANNNIAIKL